MKTAVPIILAPLAAALPGMTPRQAAQSVHDAFVAAGKDFFGVATDQGVLGQGSTRAVVTSNFGQVTGENSMKWGSLEATRGSYNWAPADYLADFAEENGLKLRGHTLVWHSQLPSWVQAITDAEELRGVIREHIATVVGRYAGKAAHWDVLNEILNEDGTLRDSVFSRLLGEEFVEIAFKAAREADPDAKLYINDYNLDQANYAKVTGMVSLVEKWVNQGIPIDGIGTQSHLGAGGGAGVQAALEKLATAPVEQIAITELDIASAPAADYTAVVQGCLNVEKCVSITVWGVSDSGENPLLFNDSFQPKEAYNAIIDLLS